MSVLGFEATAAFAAPDDDTSTSHGMALYGEIDTGFGYLHQPAGKSALRLTQGVIDGSYIGLRGSEPLGGGLRAVFALEQGFSSTDGSAINDHHKYLGLVSERFGAITVGYQYDSLFDYFAPFTLTGNSGGTAFSRPFDNDNANNSYLASNAIKYTSPEIDGFTFGGKVAFSNTAGGMARNRAFSVGARYAIGRFQIGGAYLQVDGLGRNASGAYAAQPLPLMPTREGDSIVPNYGNASAGRQRTFGIGIRYDIGEVTTALAFSRAVYTGVADADAEGSAPAPSIGFTNIEWSAGYQANSALQLTAMLAYTRAGKAYWWQGGTQAIYTLSPRTNVYIEWVGQRASAGQRAILNGFDASSGRHQWLLATGVRHDF
ncbi:porin [Robbsia sp. KACC 23696]|uniref:porin n=1 Tax=Robbsia sp. KACC 23696 TaxID=3149231 RepID=UPI00325B2EF7